MKIQANLKNPKAIMIYELIDSNVKSKAIEKALEELANSDVAEIYFGHANVAKAKDVANGKNVIENITKESASSQPKQKDKSTKELQPKNDNVEEPHSEEDGKASYKIEL